MTTQTLSTKAMLTAWGVIVATLTLAGSILVATVKITAAFSTVSADHQRIFEILDRKCP
jgi:hypothetical protein